MLAKGGGWSCRTIPFRAASTTLWLFLLFCPLYYLPHNGPALCGMTGQMGVNMYSDLVHNMCLDSGYLGSLTAMVIMICAVKE